MDIGKIREVLDFTSIAKVPQTPDFMPRVIDQRGTVAPVADIWLRLVVTRTETTINTSNITATEH